MLFVCLFNLFWQNKAQKWAREVCVSIFNWLNLIKQNMLTYCVKCRKELKNLDSKKQKMVD